MFSWLKPKSSKPPAAPQETPVSPAQSRDAVIRDMQKNMQSAKEALGSERLAYLAQLINSAPPENVDVSPRVQVQKILAKMDKDKVALLLRDLKDTPPTHH